MTTAQATAEPADRDPERPSFSTVLDRHALTGPDGWRGCLDSSIEPVPVLSPWEIAGLLGAGVVAGTVNTVVGSGSLLTFPTLIAFGYSPRVANVSNTLGLVPGSVSGALAYRRELAGQRERLRRLGAVSLLGGPRARRCSCCCRAIPSSGWCPTSILVACVLVVVQPRLSRDGARSAGGDAARAARASLLDVGVFLTAVYGGYFGAAQGVLLIGLLGIFIDDHLQRLNAAKNVLTAAVNGIAGILFVLFASIAWLPAVLLAIGAIVGGQIGAKVGRRLPADLLRLLIVVVGLSVAVKLFVWP